MHLMPFLHGAVSSVYGAVGVPAGAVGSLMMHVLGSRAFGKETSCQKEKSRQQ